MSAVNVIFVLENINLTIECFKEDKMKNICQKLSTKLNKNINSLLFLYEDKRINFESSLENQVNSNDQKNNQIKINVVENKSDCTNFNDYSKNNKFAGKINDIILCNNDIKGNINEIKLQIDNMINNSIFNSENNKLIGINNALNIIHEKIKKNNEKLLNLMGNDNSVIIDKQKEKDKSQDNKNLLQRVKSKYIQIKIFSYLDNRKKLKLVKYNKILQNNINIKLVNYKLFAGSYIIFEENGKGKEYSEFFDRMIFEGEYLKGKRNGIGKEYDEINGDLKYEGYFLKGKKNGIGKEYENGKLKFEGEYLYGKRNGKGKEYFSNGKLSFEGEFINGIRMVKEKNIMLKESYLLKENIYMVKD